MNLSVACNKGLLGIMTTTKLTWFTNYGQDPESFQEIAMQTQPYATTRAQTCKISTIISGGKTGANQSAMR